MKGEGSKQGPAYVQAFKQLGEVNAVLPESARQQMSQMVDQVARTDSNLLRVLGTDQSIPIKAGFAAEELHAESFNLDAILQKKALRAITDRSMGDWHALGLRGNDPTADIAVTDGYGIVHKSQVKYFQDAEHTANALRAHGDDGLSHYRNADSMVVPADQAQGVQDHARQTELKNTQTRPEVADAARQVREKATSHLDVDGIESQPVSKADAQHVAKGNEQGDQFRKDYQDHYMAQSTLQQMKHAAGAAAAVTAVVVGVVNTIRYLDLARQGKLTGEEAALRIVKSTAVASVDSAVKAAAATGAVSVAARQAAGVFANQSLSGLLARNAVMGGAICGVDLIKCMVMVATGRMTVAELETRTGKNLFTTGAGVTGSAIGMNLMVGSGIAFAPVVGALAGGLVAGLAMHIAIENHIEKPYRELMQNTELLRDCGTAMRDTAEAFLLGQLAFEAYLRKEKEQEMGITAALEDVKGAGGAMRQAIDRL